MNEITIADHQILVQEGKFELIGYNELLRQIDELGKHLLTIKVTPENIRENKKLVAQVRKLADNLNKERIEFKKQYLKPVDNLEKQIKVITDAVKDYETVVRKQIKDLEEQEREEKEEEILTLFNMRLRGYGSPELFPFSSFIKPQYLNKSYSVNKVELEMVSWFENRQNEINTLINLSANLNVNQTEVLNHYLTFESMTETIDYYTNMVQKKEELSKAVKTMPQRKKKIKRDNYVYFRIKEDDCDKVKSLLTLSGVGFEVSQ